MSKIDLSYFTVWGIQLYENSGHLTMYMKKTINWLGSNSFRQKYQTNLRIVSIIQKPQIGLSKASPLLNYSVYTKHTRICWKQSPRKNPNTVREELQVSCTGINRTTEGIWELRSVKNWTRQPCKKLAKEQNVWCSVANLVLKILLIPHVGLKALALHLRLLHAALPPAHS